MECLDDTSPISTPHKDGWSNEYFRELAKDVDFGTTLAVLMTSVIVADVPSKAANILSSATMFVLLKEDASTMDEIKRRLGPAYIQPHILTGMGMALGKVACSCALLLLKAAMGPAVGLT